MSKEINELVKRRAELLEELGQVTRTIEDAQTQVFKLVASETRLVHRYFDGDRIVISFGQHWWINQDGDLVGKVDDSDVFDLKTLVDSGLFKEVTIEHYGHRWTK